MFRGNSSRYGGDGAGRTAGLGLVALANEEADSVLREVEAMVRGGEDRDGVRRHARGRLFFFAFV